MLAKLPVSDEMLCSQASGNWIVMVVCRQSFLSLAIIVTWAVVLKFSAPYISDEADYTDLSGKLNQIFTLLVIIDGLLQYHWHMQKKNTPAQQVPALMPC